jgi:hypothetical protein
LRSCFGGDHCLYLWLLGGGSAAAPQLLMRDARELTRAAAGRRSRTRLRVRRRGPAVCLRPCSGRC